jgi:hypothetical protein
MKDSNDFDKEDLARWFSNVHICFWCELTEPDKKKWNYGDVFHHIEGRRGEFNASLLNCCFINNDLCHLPHHPLLKRYPSRILLLRKTLEHLMNQGYELTKLDEGFMEAHQDEYRQIVEQKELETK